MADLLTQLQRGGIMIYPLLATSILALAVFFERMLALRKKHVLNPAFVKGLEHAENQNDIKKMLDSGLVKKGPFFNIIIKAFEYRHHSRDEMKEAVINQGRKETHFLEKGLIILEIIAGIAPLMGLLGTVLGMIKVFNVISEYGLGQTQALSGGISEALITTVIGLSIAIPAMIAFHYFSHKVENLILEMEEYSANVLEKIANEKQAVLN